METEVGIRDLRNNLSHYLDRVRAGDALVVTDRGRAVAHLVPLGGERTLDRLIAAGVVTPAASPKRASPPPIETAGTVSDLVAAQRG
jgi:prevent-host-death family protein